MSKPIPAINRYRADLRELRFLLFEQFKLERGARPGALRGLGTRTRCKSTLDRGLPNGCARSSARSTPSATPRAAGSRTARSTRPKGFKDAWKKLYEGGWKSCRRRRRSTAAQGAPHRVQRAGGGDALAAPTPRSTCTAGWRSARREVIDALRHARAEGALPASACSPASGAAPCASPSRRPAPTWARRAPRPRSNADGTYSIRGTKIFISAGDHDLAENIVHLVLARVDGRARRAPRASRCSSCPRCAPNGRRHARPARNDVTVGTIEHKMGINGSATCVLNFGEGGGCVGEPSVARRKLNQGMRRCSG